jgi:hypothetical protein
MQEPVEVGNGTTERAKAFVLWFGKHRGSAIGALAETADGREYLGWLIENVGGSAAVAAQAVLREGGSK